MDAYEEDQRRRLRRRVWFWRIACLALVAILLGVLFAPTGDRGPHVARAEITGIIFDDPLRDDMFEKIAADDDVAALLIRIDSPGGTTAGSEALFESIRFVAAEKPVVAVLGEVAASGGYVAAISADWIVARGNTITGSIGVIAQAPNVEGLLEKIGVEVLEVKSTPLKAAPSPFEEPSEEALRAEREIVADSYAWFRELVAARRELGENRLETVSDGRVFTGRQALELDLIDAIGGEREARAWLAGERGVESGLPSVDWSPADEDDGLLHRVLDPLGRASDALSPGPRLFSILR